MSKITMTTLKQEKTGKVTYKTVETETREITRQEYNNIISPETIRFFKRLGGSESVIREYTRDGYLITEIKSTSPDREKRTVRCFEFKMESN